VITGVERRRDWSTEQKLEIVAESLVDGVVVSDVARRHGISPQQLFGWRAKLRSAIRPAAPTPAETSAFAPVLVDESSSRRIAALEPPRQRDEAPAIEITLGSAIVRVRGAVDARTLAAVLKVLRVLA
jgi:transposase